MLIRLFYRKNNIIKKPRETKFDRDYLHVRNLTKKIDGLKMPNPKMDIFFVIIWNLKFYPCKYPKLDRKINFDD